MGAEKAFQLVLVDADALRRRSFREALAAEPEFRIAIDAGDVSCVSDEALQSCDFLLLTLGRPGVSALAPLQAVAGRRPAGRLLVIAEEVDDDLLRLALRLGASAVLLARRPASRVVSAMREALLGHFTMDEDIIRRVVVDRDGLRMGPRGDMPDEQERKGQ